MRYCLSIILLALACIFSYSTVNAQENNKTENDQPVILYNGTPKKYEIADIKVTDIENYEDYVLIGISGLAVGQTITVPGDDITSAIKRYWRHGLFSDVKITAEKIEDNKIYLYIHLSLRPRITDIRFHGVKKSEREDLQAKLGMAKGSQVTPNLIDHQHHNRQNILLRHARPLRSADRISRAGGPVKRKKPARCHACAKLKSEFTSEFCTPGGYFCEF